MLIASLERLSRRGETIYAASDPFDGELLTQWHSTITQVEDELRESDSPYGLMTACYRGESDVPLRIGEDGTEDAPGSLVPCGSDSVYCH